MDKKGCLKLTGFILEKENGKRNKGKRFAKQLLSVVINALASIYCVYCCQNQTALKTNKKNSYSSVLLLTAFPSGEQ